MDRLEELEEELRFVQGQIGELQVREKELKSKIFKLEDELLDDDDNYYMVHGDGC